MKKLAVLALAILISPVYADVRYTKKVTFNHGDAEGMSMQTTTYLKNRRERQEMFMQAGPMKIQQIELTLCDLEKKARLDSDLKITPARPCGPDSVKCTIRWSAKKSRKRRSNRAPAPTQ